LTSLLLSGKKPGKNQDVIALRSDSKLIYPISLKAVIMKKIEIFRINHRKKRDPRLTTHLCLAARAFGASAVYYSGERDLQLEKSVNDVTKHWGGPFKIKFIPKERSFVKNYRGTKIHLTMYGEPFNKKLIPLRATRYPLLIIVGGPKVPPWIYSICDYNLSVTSQPHSEVSALAVFLHELQSGKELNKQFKGGKLKIVPQKSGKKMVRQIPFK